MELITRNKSIVPSRTMHTGRMSGHSTKLRRTLIAMSIITMRSSIGYLPQTLRPFVYALQNLDRNFANLVAPPTNISAKCLVL